MLPTQGREGLALLVPFPRSGSLGSSSCCRWFRGVYGAARPTSLKLVVPLTARFGFRFSSVSFTFDLRPITRLRL